MKNIQKKQTKFVIVWGGEIQNLGGGGGFPPLKGPEKNTDCMFTCKKPDVKTTEVLQHAQQCTSR